MKDKILNTIYEFLKTKKIENISILDISDISIISDYFVIVSIDNMRLLEALKNDIVKVCTKENIIIKNIEGDNSPWILIDLVDVVIHLFIESERKFYNLEKIWADAKRIELI
ncbi:MAG: ribosome silencing factor [Eubacteriales bacterium]|nr:ribosome silencing factor [Eubacteriales bacterium]